MLNFSFMELSVIFAIALFVFGPGKLPEVGKALGKGIQEFKRAVNTDPVRDEPIKLEKKKRIKSDARGYQAGGLHCWREERKYWR